MKRIHHLNIIPPTLLLALSAFSSSVLGVIRDRMLATTFGATSGAGIYNLDAYYAAFKIPDLLYFILVLGAASAAFIPIFTQHKKEGAMKEAWEFASAMLHLMLIIISIVSLLAFIFAPYLAKIVAAGFDQETFDITVHLMRIMFLSPLIFTVSSVLISLQDSFKTFFYRSLGPIFYNIGIIISIVFFSEKFGVVGITWGVIFGALLQLLVQLPSLKTIGYKHVWSFDYKRKDVRKALIITVPRIISGAMYQISQVAYTLIASFLATGSITIIYFANNLYSLPLAIIAVSFSITSFATFSELATEDTMKPLSNELMRVMQQVMFLVLPATIGVLLLRSEIIDAILVGGEFTQQDAVLTSKVLLLMLMSLFTHSLILLLNRAYYALHDTKTPLLGSLIAAVSGISFAYYLSIIQDMGVIGIGLAISVANIVFFLFLYGTLRKRLGFALLRVGSIFKMLVASGLMGVAVYLSKLSLSFPMELTYKYIYLVVISVFGAVVYFIVAHFMKIPEREMILRQLKRLK